MTECVNTPYAARMQDRYTGDVGDFGKYGLLRQLCGLRDEDAEPLKLGVVWYRPNPELIASESVHDGRYIAYLCPKQKNVSEKQKREYRCCDPPLYDGLREIVKRCDRRIEAVENSDLLPDAAFHRADVPGPVKGARGEARIAERQRWVNDALEATADCDVVFLDPDNGLEPKRVPITRKMAPKYAYLEEVGKWSKRCQSLVIYHHLGRHRSHLEQIEGWLERLRNEFQPHDTFALHFRRGTSRAFFVLATAEHADVLRERANALVESPWSEHFELHE